jgi:adenine C2-methylase RlmN of 23S rRNA A2503 and tRNA A37
MACPFCATGQAGLTRNLSTAEIVEQVVAAQRTESARGGRVSNVVFMGMGEPLANYRRVVDAVRASPSRRRTASASASAASSCRPSAWCRRSTSSPRRACR